MPILSGSIHVQVHTFNRGVISRNTVIYLPEKSDIEKLNSLVKDAPFWDQILSNQPYSLNETTQSATQPTLFNCDYAIISAGKKNGHPVVINLSTVQKARVADKLTKRAEYPCTILNNDLSIKLDKPLLREPIGFVTRGDYSQARGHSMGLGAISDGEIIYRRLRALTKTLNVKKGTGVIALFRQPTSLVYHPCWLFEERPF
jgi:hypothetical protein